MKSLELLDPTHLYNMLQHATVFPCLSDPNFTLLLDAREKSDYNESHVITAKKAPVDSNKDFIIPYDAELECKQNVVIYDSNTTDLAEDSPAVRCGKAMWDMGSRNTVKILKGGYEQFSALYPFLRTQKILYMPREMDELETYPAEIIPGLLYLGNWRQANAPNVQKDLKIQAHINCCVETGSFFSESSDNLLHLPVPDENDSHLFTSFKKACTFIDKFKDEKKVVLVFSQLGISRSATVVMAYLMYHFKWSLKEAYEHALKCSPIVRPNRGFVVQLQQLEKQLHGRSSTDIRDPNF
ncbi:serine/threonine/tyrosine-interacting-like protein 1 [Liolophura sinensis]|uniref:serine/threonine/tyrosine-interacting-like protein 1 n=1 Tax=Liolophura sinensis TaxID=3198878 RepID=UPI0031582F02